MCCVSLLYMFVQDMERIYGVEKGGYDDCWQVCCYCVLLYYCVNVLFLIGGLCPGVEVLM